MKFWATLSHEKSSGLGSSPRNAREGGPHAPGALSWMKLGGYSPKPFSPWTESFFLRCSFLSFDYFLTSNFIKKNPQIKSGWQGKTLEQDSRWSNYSPFPVEPHSGHLGHLPGQRGLSRGEHPEHWRVLSYLFEVAIFSLLPVHHVMKDGNHDIPHFWLWDQCHTQKRTNHSRNKVDLMFTWTTKPNIY